MTVVRMVQVTRDHVVDVITVAHWLVTAGRPMLMVGLVLRAIVLRRAISGIGVGNGDLAHRRCALHRLLRCLSFRGPRHARNLVQADTQFARTWAALRTIGVLLPSPSFAGHASC